MFSGMKQAFSIPWTRVARDRATLPWTVKGSLVAPWFFGCRGTTSL